MPHVGQEILTDFTPFGEFIMSPIHYIYLLYFTDYCLFALISLTALSQTYFVSPTHISHSHGLQLSGADDY